jgi:uncharacterized membrane protein (Fun14 family)
VSAQEPGPADAQSGRLRWLGRGVVLAIGAGTLARVMIVVAVVLGVAFAVVGLLYLARRGREG